MNNQYTNEESVSMFLDSVKVLASYWAKQDGTKEEVCDGLAFSILSMIDGCASLPPIDLVFCVDDVDRKYALESGQKHHGNEAFNSSVMLHEMYCKYL